MILLKYRHLYKILLLMIAGFLLIKILLLVPIKEYYG